MPCSRQRRRGRQDSLYCSTCCVAGTHARAVCLQPCAYIMSICTGESVEYAHGWASLLEASSSSHVTAPSRSSAGKHEIAGIMAYSLSVVNCLSYGLMRASCSVLLSNPECDTTSHNEQGCLQWLSTANDLHLHLSDRGQQQPVVTYYARCK